MALDAGLAFERVNSLKVNSLWTMLEMPDKVGQSTLNVSIITQMASSSAEYRSVLNSPSTEKGPSLNSF